jgi:hypothetical protein
MVKKPETHPYLAGLMLHLGGEMVEVFNGDSGTNLKFSEYDLPQKSVIRGKMIEAIGDCLILEIKDHTKVYLNAWAISSVVPLKDPLFIKDVYDDAEFDLKRKGKNR